MKKSFHIFQRDLSRLLHNKAAILVLIGVCLLPSLYAWFNIAANLDPYGNTSKIKVAIACLDKEASSENLSINAGKEIVKNIIGEKHIIPTLGIYNKFNEIEKDKLPERFVIKCTHDSGGVCICKNKNKFNWEEAEKKINKSLKNEFFWNHREYPYKGIKPRIMIEEYLEDNSPKGLVDYKFFCFHGEPRLVLVASNRQKNVNFDFFDMDFKHCPFKQEYDILSKDLIEKPTLFEEMKKIAKVLSKDILHVRVDLYCINNHIYFGEYTFFNNAGNENFIPQEWDTIIGSWLTLPLQSKNYQQI
jgi:hypothetical protein